MSYTSPSRTTVGFEFSYNIFGFSANPVPFELVPNQAFKKGQLVCLGQPGQAATNCLKLKPFVGGTDQIDEEILVGVMAESIAQADNPSDEVTYGLVYCNPGNIYRVSFTNEADIQGDSTQSDKTKMNLASVTNANNIRGTLMYIYEGPGAGHMKTITAASTDDWIQWVGEIDSPTTTDTKAFLLSANVNSAGINIGSVGVTVNNEGMLVDVGAALDATENPLKVVGVDPKHKMLDVMLHGQLHI